MIVNVSFGDNKVLIIMFATVRGSIDRSIFFQGNKLIFIGRKREYRLLGQLMHIYTGTQRRGVK